MGGLCLYAFVLSRSGLTLFFFFFFFQLTILAFAFVDTEKKK